MRNLFLSTSAFALVLGTGVATASATDYNSGKPAPQPTKDSVVTTVTEKHEFSNKVSNDWSWNKDVTEKVNINANINVYVPNLNELTQISNVQKLFGSVTATTNIDSYIAPGGSTTTTTTPGGTYGLSGSAPVYKQAGPNKQYEDQRYADLSGVTVKIPTTTTTTTASALPVVLGSATAIGNMFSLSSSEPTLLLNSDQIHMPETGSVAVTAALNSTVTGAAVKLDSTAISNMLSVNMSDPTVVIGSIMQTSYADVSATATSKQTIGGGYDYASFDGLNPRNIDGGLQVKPADMTGVVASVNATAIGNMASINLGSYASIPQGAGTSLGN